MELSFNLDDDLFFADLTRQLSLLITEDDDDDDRRAALTFPNPSVSFQPFYGATVANMENSKSKGTGVFIPMMLQPRRRQRTARSRSRNRSSYHYSNTTRATANSPDSLSKTSVE